MAQKQYPIINNFSKGELSSRMEGRVDIQGYYNGCKIMENCIMVAQGGAEKRPGTVYIGEVYNNDSITRLIPFEVSDTEIYILEFSSLAMRIWDVQAKSIVSDPEGKGRDYITTEYAETELAEIQFAQTEGIIFFAHNGHPLRQLVLDNSQFSWLSMGFRTTQWETGMSVTRGMVVANDGIYYIAQRDFTSTTAPISGDWEVRGDVPSALSGDVTYWTSGVYAIGTYKVYEEVLWKCIKITTGTETPGVPVPTPTITWVARSKWFWIGESPTSYFNKTYGIGNWKFISSNPIVFVGQTVNIEYKVPTDVPVYYWEDAGVSLPDIASPQTLVSYVAGTYDSYDYVYDPTSFVLYRSIIDSNTSALSDDKDWDVLDGNPLFNIEGDYPAAIAFMGDRLYLAGTKSRPQTISASKIGDYNNFSIGIDDDDAFVFTMAADRSSRIKWMMAKDVLMVGTTSSEWLVSGLTPTSIQVLRQSAYGSAYQQATFVADSLLFYQKGGRKVREYVYSNDNKAYLANDLTFFADHITFSGIIDSTYQQNPDSILWSTKNDGSLIGLTYDRLNQIAGWHRQTTQGLFESVTSVDGEDGEDELWFVVRRSVNGSVVRYIERMNTRYFESQSAAIFVDSAKTQSAGELFGITSLTWTATKVTATFVGTADFVNGNDIKIFATDTDNIDGRVFQVDGLSGQTFDLFYDGSYYVPVEFTDPETGTLMKVTDTMTGLSHLEGETVSILGDGAVFSDQEVVSGGITLSSKCNTIVAGLSYTMRLMPESIELQGTLGAKKRISSVDLKLYNTLGGHAGPSESNMEVIDFRDTTVPFGSPPPLFTGNKTVNFDTESGVEANILIYHNQPLPMTVLAIISDITFSRS